MNVLSLFDGMSCGRIALQELCLPVTRYYASEIDKFAIQQSTLNFPDTIHLGSITEVDVSKLAPIDLLIGGSPCQSFSFAGKRKGMVTKCDIEILNLDTYLALKSAGFKFEGQSYLFWEYVRILRDIQKYNPSVKFLLENVKMGKKWEAVLTGAIGCGGIHINSALVCAQNRRRIYWTNIEGIQQPVDRGILLREILEDEVDEKYYLSSAATKNMSLKALEGDGIIGRSGCGGQKDGVHGIEGKCTYLMATDYKQPKQILKLDKQLNPKRDQFKAGAHSGGNHSDMDLICVAMRGRNPENPSDRTTEQRLEPCSDEGKTNCLATVGKDNLIMGCDYRSDEGVRLKHDGKAGTLRGQAGFPGSCGQQVLTQRQEANGMTLVGTPRIRRLTPKECCRLQTVPDWYKWAASDTQQYKMLGNGWTVEVIKHILSYWWEGHTL